MKIRCLVLLFLVLALPAGQALAFGGKVDSGGMLNTEKDYLQPRVPPVVITWSQSGNQTPPAISIGANHASGIKVEQDGSLWFFGVNDFGQFGDGSTNQNWSNWQQVQTPEPVAMVAGGYNFTYIVGNDGRVWAAGYDDDGQIGDGLDGNGHEVPGWAPSLKVGGGQLSNIVAIAAGREFGMAIDNQGQLWVIGDNDMGQIGIENPNGPNFCDMATLNGPTYCLGDPFDSKGWVPVDPQTFGGSTVRVVEIAAGNDFALVLTNTGDVYGVGDNADWETGYPTQGVLYRWTKTATNMIHIAAGWYHALAIDGTHHLWGAGRNVAGQLGNGTTADPQTWVEVDADHTYQALGTEGLLHSYAIGDDGDLYAAGDNSTYAYGNNSNVSSTVWMKVMPGPISQVCSAVDVSSIDTPNTFIGSSTFNGGANVIGLVNRQGQPWFTGTAANGTQSAGAPQPYWIPK